MSIESAALPIPDVHEAKPHPRPTMTPRAKRIGWITGKITISAGALAAALIWAAPRVADGGIVILDKRYAQRDTLNEFRGLMLNEMHEIHRLLAVADSNRKCDRGRKDFCP